MVNEGMPDHEEFDRKTPVEVAARTELKDGRKLLLSKVELARLIAVQMAAGFCGRANVQLSRTRAHDGRASLIHAPLAMRLLYRTDEYIDAAMKPMPISPVMTSGTCDTVPTIIISARAPMA